jgi:hypothetical protein
MNAIFKSSKIALKVSLVILIVLLPTRSLVAQSWLPGWIYRSPVTVSNSVATDLTDFQVQITLNSGNFDFSMAKTDGSDIRITWSDGIATIPFWIESWTQGTTANIWVKVPSIPASGTTTLYLYYGNTSATGLSSGNNTFNFFDDFESSSWSVTPHPSVWQDLSSSAPIPTPSADATASVYNNKLYTFGGYGIGHVVLNTTYEFNPGNNVWTNKAPMPTNRWGMVSVGFGGKIYVFGGANQGNIGVDVNEIYDPSNDTWQSRKYWNPLSTIPKYTGLGVTHPDVIYFPGGKDGYEYWMVYTPYPWEPDENPSIVRSHDGINWTDAGITNPVIPLGEPGAWNGEENPDPDFIFVSDIDGLHLGHDKWFMVWDGGDCQTCNRKIALAYSDDGKTWTQYKGSPVNGNANPVILSGTDSQGVAWETDGTYSKTATTTLFYKDGTFYLFYAEEATGNNRGKIGLATFTWDNTTSSVVGLTRNAGNPIIDLPDDAIFKSGGGHIDIAKNQGSETYRMYIVRELLGTDTNYELGLLTSSSLTSGWTNQGKAIARGAAGEWDETHIYRSCPVVNSSGEIVLTGNNIRMYYGGVNSDVDNTGWRIGIADIDQTTGSVVKFTGTAPRPMPAGIANQGLMGISDGTKIHLFYMSYHYEYYPATDTYVQKSDVPHPRTWATCAFVNNSIYLIGGFSYEPDTYGGSDNNQKLNISSDTWEAKTPSPRTRYGATRESPVINGNIYITHGWNNYWFYTANYMYDPDTDTWEQKGSANHPRDGVACGVIGGKLYVVGGRDVPASPYGINYNEVYDPASDNWVPTDPPSTWTTSGANFVYTDGTAKYQGNKGLVIRDPMDGSPSVLYSAETVAGFGSVYALDFDWNITTLGGIAEADLGPYPYGVVRLTDGLYGYGSMHFYEENGPVMHWYDQTAGTVTPLQSSTWNEWHKVTIVRNGSNSRVVFDGNIHSGLSMPTDGNGYVRFGAVRSTQYLDNVRIRKWADPFPVTTVGSMAGLQGQWTGAVNTAWNNGSNWSDGSVPDANVNVVIPSGGNQPVISATALCNNISINSGATLQIASTGTLTISGNWTNNGTFTANESTVVFNGTSPQIGAGGFFNLTISGSGTFTNAAVISGTLAADGQSLTISNGGSLTIGPLGNATIGGLTNNGTLNLKSDATGIASLIVDTYARGTGGIENIELYLTGGGNQIENNWKWHYISSPVTSLSVSDVIGTGAGSTNNLAAYYETYATPTNKNLGWYGYDGWNYQNANGTPYGPTIPDPLEIGRGYNYFSYGDATRTFGGTINTGFYPRNLSYTGATNNMGTKGWNLIGNPYTAGINWDDVSRSPTGIDNAIYFTKDNGFASYINGVGNPDGTTGFIPPMQGFFVKANQPSRNITFNPINRIHTGQNRFKGEGEIIPLLRLKIEGLNMSDEAVIRFNEKAKTTFDEEFDAYKFSTTGTAVSLWTFIGPVNYSINSIPFPEIKTEIPVGMNAIESGTFKLTATQLQGLDNYNIYLIDKLTGNTTDLKITPSINFAASDGMVTDRFVIKVINILTGIENPVISKSVFNIYSSKDFVNIQTLSDEWDGKSGSVDLIDMTGRTIRKIDNEEFSKNSLIRIPVTGYSGIYFVKVQSGFMRYVGKVMIM